MALPTADLDALANERQLLALLDSIDGVVFEYDLELDRYVVVRGKAEELLGYPAEDWLAPGFWTEHVHPDDLESAHGFCLESIEARRDHQFEYRMLARDGRTVWVHDHVTMVLREGQPRALRGVMLDVTERRRAERTLREISAATSTETGEEFFRGLTRHLAGALQVRVAVVAEVLSDAPGRMRTIALWVGDRHVENIEYDIETSPCSLALRAGGLCATDTLAEDFPDNPVLRALRARSYLGVALHSAARSGVGVLAVLHDTPIPLAEDARSVLRIFAGRAGAELERQHAEDALRQSEGRNRALVQALPDAIFVLDAGGTFLDCHASDPRALLAPPEQFIGRRIGEILPPGVAGLVEPLMHEALATRQPRTCEYPLALNGEERRFECRMLAFGLDRVLVLARDITEQRRLEERLAQSQKLESIGRLAGGVAHDFNNLLTGILSYAEIGEQEAGAGALADYFARIRQAGERAAELTQQMLAFARKQIVAPRVITPNALVEELLPFLRRVIGEHVRLEATLASESWRTRIDPTQLSQVLLNLVVNARDALPQGGVARVATRNVQLGSEQDGAAPGDYVELSVSDAGVGMDERTRAHVFEPFFTTKGAGRGTGMGLATCYGIVRQNGGAIRIESRKGQGTRVCVLLPRVEQPCDDAPPSPGGAGPGRETVLLVEDESTVREIAVRALRAQGYEVLAAADGAEALEVARPHLARLDLLISDVVMPRMGGIELAARLRSARAELPVLFISGYAPDESDDAHRGLERAALLRKPFAPGALARKVREVLDARAPAV